MSKQNQTRIVLKQLTDPNHTTLQYNHLKKSDFKHIVSKILDLYLSSNEDKYHIQLRDGVGDNRDYHRGLLCDHS